MMRACVGGVGREGRGAMTKIITMVWEPMYLCRVKIVGMGCEKERLWVVRRAY